MVDEPIEPFQTRIAYQGTLDNSLTVYQNPRPEAETVVRYKASVPQWEDCQHFCPYIPGGGDMRDNDPGYIGGICRDYAPHFIGPRPEHEWYDLRQFRRARTGPHLDA